jgi:hypothetical protein
MKKLSKAQVAEKQQHVTKLREMQGALEKAVADYNARLDELKGPVEQALHNLNAQIALVNEWVYGLSGEMNEHFDTKSDRWQESDRGQAYNNWKEDSSAELDEVEINFPDPMEEPEITCADEMEDRAEGPN